MKWASSRRQACHAGHLSPVVDGQLSDLVVEPGAAETNAGGSRHALKDVSLTYLLCYCCLSGYTTGAQYTYRLVRTTSGNTPACYHNT
jgi:hypothetical protein